MREYLLVMLIAALGTFLLCGPCRRVAVRTGALAPVRERDVHSRPTPYLGGVAMLIGVLAAFLLAIHLPFLGRHATLTHDALGIFVAAAVICVIGAIDDAIDLPWMAKIAGQVLAAGVVVLNGVRMYWVSLPHQIIALDTPTSLLVTVLYIFVCVNAVNLIDGLDGLASGVVGIGALALLLYTYLLAYQQQFAVATTASLVSATIAGICAGFLPHNFHPARIFMGDSGALTLGVLIAAAGILVTGQIDPANASVGYQLPAIMPLIVPAAVILLPLIDLVWAVVRRVSRGQSPFHADAGHLHHRLLRLGHSHTGAVLVLYMWATMASFTCVALVRYPATTVGPAAIALSLVGVIVTARQFRPRRFRRNGNGRVDATTRIPASEAK